MKTFKDVKEGEHIYSVDSNGNVIIYNVIGKVEDWHEHMITFYLPEKYICVGMYMYMYSVDDEDNEDNTIMYFADKDNALSELREIAEKANEVIQNCLKSMDIFS